MTTQLLFVCLGNICRSPTAEGIMRQKVKLAERTDIICDSAGTSRYHIGAPPDQRMTQAAASYGYGLAGAARQITVADFATFDLILAMDRDNYRDICQLAATANQPIDRVKLMCSYCRHHADPDVPDPYFGGEAGFRYVVELLEDACEGLLETL